MAVSPPTATAASGTTFWLFGGYGEGAGSGGWLSDVWKYDPTSSTWTWESGSQTLSEDYTSTNPGGVVACAVAENAEGTAWLFGGSGEGDGADSNYFWQFVDGGFLGAGGQGTGQYGIYGTRGVVGSFAYPGSRNGAAMWADSELVFLFGGLGRGATADGELDDFWVYRISAP